MLVKDCASTVLILGHTLRSEVEPSIDVETPASVEFDNGQIPRQYAPLAGYNLQARHQYITARYAWTQHLNPFRVS